MNMLKVKYFWNADFQHINIEFNHNTLWKKIVNNIHHESARQAYLGNIWWYDRPTKEAQLQYHPLKKASIGLTPTPFVYTRSIPGLKGNVG